jgi:hypothetical protein
MSFRRQHRRHEHEQAFVIIHDEDAGRLDVIDHAD